MRKFRRKAGNSDKVFGCDLLEHLAATCQEVPQVLRSCSEFIEEHGVVDGIYRLSGVSSNTQKLRSEFDSEGTPDLNKDIYLQDIHCVSSLCKAYFRELPNPLLTYQLYDKYAEAVAIQLEEERLVKIRDVLKELPAPNYRTLEFLMRHLVRMASHSSHTNMHARNLAIVWAPNLLRSKDIEASGFNGTAAFMEVRVQSIVVEFILTHVPQLFPDSGVGLERRKSLPSPSIHSPEEPFFRSIPLQLGNISPGDGPPAMRSYHAIIDGTDKRKGSLKGRKWKSIFNLGGRLHDPRRRNKNSTKEKEKTVLRPAKSMDSLSSGPYLHEGTKQHLLSTAMPPLTPPSPCLPGGADGGAPSSGMGSGYAVTYRRGQGASVSVVSGGGTQGTYSRLDSCGGNSTDALQPPSRSPGISSKADRRAGIHISGPFSVTVPLHITSGLAFGVLQGGGADRGTHRGQEGGDKDEVVEGERNTEWAGERPHSQGKVLGEGVPERGNRQDEAPTVERRDDDRKVDTEEEQEVREGKVNGDRTSKPAEDTECEEDAEISDDKEQDDEEGEYMDMKGSVQALLNAQDVPYYPMDYDAPEQDCPLDFQDTFGFLDLMDSSGSQMFQEFSVEPHHGEDEYEDEVEQSSPGLSPNRPDPVPEPSGNTHTQLQTHTPTHRPLRLDQFGQINKSMSLPYMSRPFLPALSSSSEDDVDDDDDDDDDYNKDDEEDDDMFCKSLPSSLVFNRLTWSGPTTELENSLSTPTGPSQLLDCGSDDRPILMGQSQSTEVEKDIESPECCDPSEEGLSHSNADGEDMMTAMESQEDGSQDTGRQEKRQRVTLINTSSESTEVEESCHNVKNRITEEEECPAVIGQALASASTSPGSESSLQTTADGKGEDTRVLLVRDEDEILSSCGEGGISKSSNEETMIEDKAAEVWENSLTVSHMVSGAEEPEDIMKEQPEDIMKEQPEDVFVDSSGGVMEQPESSVKREMVGGGEDEKIEEDMKQNKDRNVQNKILVEEIRAENEGDRTEVKEVLVLEKDVMVEEKDVMVEEKDVMVEEKDVMVEEKDVMVEEKDVMVEEKDVMVEEKNVMVEEKNVMVEEKNVMVEEKDVMVEEKDVMVEEKDVMVEEKDVMVEEKDVQQKEDRFEEMNSIVVREDMVDSGESTNGPAETKESMVMEEVIETKEDRPEIHQDEIMNYMITKDETNRHEEGTDTIRETAGGRMEKSLTDDEEQDLHVVQGRERDTHLIKDVVAEADREGDKEIDQILVEQQQAEGDTTGQDEEEANEETEKERVVKEPTVREEELKEVRLNSTEPNGRETEGSKAGFEKGHGRVLVTSKQQAKVYQVRSVPVVPPKPHHCRLTALNLRQQQDKVNREVDRDRESVNVHRALGQHDTDKEKKMGGHPEHEHGWNEERDGEGRGRREWQAQCAGERRRDVDDMTRSSPISMCFDEAVAMGIKRGREKEGSERDKQREDMNYNKQ